MRGRLFFLALISAYMLDGQAQVQTAPPRSVADIIAILDQYKPDEASLAKLRAQAEAQPPDTKHEQELAIFYHRRGRANKEVGNSKQQIADFETALRLALPSGITEAEGIGQRFRIVLDLIAAEIHGGNGTHVVKLAKDLAAENTQWSQFWGNYYLALANSGILNLQAARHFLSLADKNLESLKTTRDWALFGIGWQSAHELAHGVVLNTSGNYGEAERRLRAATELAEQNHWKAFEVRKISRYASAQWSTLSTWAIHELMLAQNLAKQGRIAEAEYFARNALVRQLQVSGRFSHYSTLPTRVLAGIILESGRFREAEALVEKGIESSEKAGVTPESPSLADARAVLGKALVAQGRWKDANSVFEARDRGLAADQQQYALKNGDDPYWGIALMRLGNVKASLTIQERIYRKRLSSGIPDSDLYSAQIRGFYAMALASDGQFEKALGEFQGAIPVLLDSARRNGGSEQEGAVARQLHLVWILEAYMQLLIDLRESPLLKAAGIDAAAEAFRIADVARGSAVQRALAESAARATPNDPALADLARREQDAQQRYGTLSDLLNRLLSAPPERQLPKVIADLRRDIETLRVERDKLKIELDKRFPEYADLIAPKPTTLGQVQAALNGDEALISIYVGSERSYVWAVPKTGNPAFAELPLSDVEMAERVRYLRESLDVGEVPLESIPRFDLGKSYDLYRQLLQPVEKGWQSARNLIVVPHKALGQLPFAVLATAPVTSVPVRSNEPAYTEYRTAPWLIRRAAVMQLPSVSTLLALRRMPAAKPGRTEFIGFGDPLFSTAMVSAPIDGDSTRRRMRNLSIDSVATKTTGIVPEARVEMPNVSVANSAGLGQLARLPDTADEITSIARVLNADLAKDVFLGRAASEVNVKSGQLANRRIVMFATHGLVPGDLNGLMQPALALSAPEVTGNANEDGLLTMEEVLALKLNADWVVLSACNTASGNGAGSEAVSGLGKAFFFAGARALLVSNWPVETVSAKLLTTRLFEHQIANPSATRAEALRATMLDLMDRSLPTEMVGTKGYSYAHPMFWAPFSLVGDGGK